MSQKERAFDSLTEDQKEVIAEMVASARDVLRGYGFRPPVDDRAGAFEDACVELLLESRPARAQHASPVPADGA